jgi:CDP-6-deoxy-D-xylo-4-hexulose-3-dehydrase
MTEISFQKNELRKKILALVAEYGELAGAPQSFVPGETLVPPSGKVVGTPEMQLMVDASLDALADHRSLQHIVRKPPGRLPWRQAPDDSQLGIVCESGCVFHPDLAQARRPGIRPGDEVIVWRPDFDQPSIQSSNAARCRFVDVHIPTYNIDVDQLEAAISPRTKAIMLAHTLAIPTT